MSSEYADRRLAEVLADAGYTQGAARRILLERVAKDERLLRELVKPFLTGIVGHAIERAARTMPKHVPATPAKPLSGSVLDGVIRALGENFAQSGGPLGLRSEPPSRGPASARHAETMRGLAKAHIRQRAG